MSDMNELYTGLIRLLVIYDFLLSMMLFFSSRNNKIKLTFLKHTIHSVSADPHHDILIVIKRSVLIAHKRSKNVKYIFKLKSSSLVLFYAYATLHFMQHF